MLEITFDPKEEAVMRGLRLDPQRHERLPDGEWLGWVKRQLGHPTLLLFRHRAKNTFVVADVIYGDDVVVELEAMPGHPDRSAKKRPTLAWMRRRLEPAAEVYKRIFDNLREQRVEEERMRAGNYHEREQTRGWLKKKVKLILIW